jgi:ABC-2 type transport system ATP-binding protein
MIVIDHISKRYGDQVAVDDLTFDVKPGVVTGFLGPNGAGKSTTMRMIIGLDRPDSGQITIDGRRYAEHRAPIHEVGALLEAKAVHPARSARNHLRAVGATTGIGSKRVDEVLEMVGLGGAAGRRAGAFSLGMSQRLGIAGALLADPEILLFDEPVNGLDPEGILWVRGLLGDLAAQGRTVFVSSHLITELGAVAEHLVIIGRGRMIAEIPMSELGAGAAHRSVHVRSPQAAELAELIRGAGITVKAGADREIIEITGLDSQEVGRRAAAAGIVLYELTPRTVSLEQAFMDLTRDSTEYTGHPDGPAATHAAAALDTASALDTDRSAA